jgi:hypothetical protein
LELLVNHHGEFLGNPKTEWLVNPSGEDQTMQLLEDFSFIDPAGIVWPAPKSSIVDGASIPRELWSLVGSPYTGDYRRASVVHDIACNTPSVNRKEADVMFFHACHVGGCSPTQACVLYAGVRIGAWWGSVSLFSDSLEQDQEELLRGKFIDIKNDMKALPPEPSIEEMDAIIERHIQI